MTDQKIRKLAKTMAQLHRELNNRIISDHNFFGLEWAGTLLTEYMSEGSEEEKEMIRLARHRRQISKFVFEEALRSAIQDIIFFCPFTGKWWFREGNEAF